MTYNAYVSLKNLTNLFPQKTYYSNLIPDGTITKKVKGSRNVSVNLKRRIFGLFEHIYDLYTI